MTNTLPALDNQAASGHNWKEFDALPREVRDFLNYHPVSQGTHGAFQMYVVWGYPFAEVSSRVLAISENYLAQLSRSTYGVDYPCLPLSSLIDQPLDVTRRSPTSGGRNASAAGRRSRRTR